MNNVKTYDCDRNLSPMILMGNPNNLGFGQAQHDLQRFIS